MARIWPSFKGMRWFASHSRSCQKTLAPHLYVWPACTNARSASLLSHGACLPPWATVNGLA